MQSLLNYYPNYSTRRLYFGEVETSFSHLIPSVGIVTVIDAATGAHLITTGGAHIYGHLHPPPRHNLCEESRIVNTNK